LSSTEWAGTQSSITFIPNVFVTLTEEQVQRKIEAFKLYGTEVMEAPNPRSIEGVMNQAKYRGQIVSKHFAECFFMVRSVI
jgi:N-acetylglucosamine malate deacetylase 1